MDTVKTIKENTQKEEHIKYECAQQLEYNITTAIKYFKLSNYKDETTLSSNEPKRALIELQLSKESYLCMKYYNPLVLKIWEEGGFREPYDIKIGLEDLDENIYDYAIKTELQKPSGEKKQFTICGSVGLYEQIRNVGLEGGEEK